MIRDDRSSDAVQMLFRCCSDSVSNALREWHAQGFAKTTHNRAGDQQMWRFSHIGMHTHEIEKMVSVFSTGSRESILNVFWGEYRKNYFSLPKYQFAKTPLDLKNLLQPN